MKNFYVFLIITTLLLTGTNVYSQVHFTPVGNFIEGAMNINILEAKVNGVNLVAGDEIGIFDGNVCVGSVILTKNLVSWNDNNIAASKAGADDVDTGNKDGFITGNTISFRLYDASETEEIPVVVATFFNLNDGSEIVPPPTFDKEVTGFVSLTATHNYTPKARAGVDKELQEGETGSLDGSSSYDFEGLPITFTWKDIDNLGISATNINKPTYTAPLVNADKKYRLELKVNDGEKNSKPDTVVVTVKQINYPPVANAGADFDVPEAEVGKLNGSASTDPDGLALTYSWIIVPADFTPAASNAVTTDFTAPLVTGDTEYKAILTVTNTVLLNDKDTVIVKVINHNLKPVANAGADVAAVNEGIKVTLDGSGSSDPDNAPNATLTYKWTSAEGLTINNSTTVSPDFTTPFYKKDSTLRMILVVNDGALDSKTDTVLVKVKHANLTPTANAGVDQNVDEGVKVTLNGSASSDPDKLPNVTLTYKWTSVQGLAINGSTTASPDFTTLFYMKDTTLKFVLVVNDGAIDSKKDTVSINAKHKNLAPVANAGTDVTNVNEGVKVTLDGSASSDADELPNVTLTYKWTSVQGLTINGSTTALPDFTTLFYKKDSTLQFVLVVNDGEKDSKTDTVLVKVKHANLTPTANAGVDQNVDEGVKVTLNGSASSDPDKLPNVTLTYKWTSVQGLTINGSTTALPDFTTLFYKKDTTLKFVLVVNDGAIDSKKDTVSINVKHKNLAPVANAGTDVTDVNEGVKVTLDGSASSDADKLPNVTLTYKWTSVQGLTINGSTTALPDFTTLFYKKDSTLQFVLVVNDGALDSKTDTVLVKVKHANLTPTANAGVDQNVDEGVKVTLNGSASSDPDKLPNVTLTYKWTSVQGLTINGSTTASPDFTTLFYKKDTTLQFVLVVNDGALDSKKDTVSINVKHKNLDPVANAGTDVTDVNEGVKVTLDGSASSDADKLPNVTLTYKWTSVQGLTINGSTTASPDFTTLFYKKDSTLQFVLVVNDGALDSKKDTVLVKVKHKNLVPTANAGTDFSVNENTLGQLNGAGSSDLDGTLTYQWTATGVSITGATSVNPAFTAPEVQADSVITFTLTVTDNNLGTDNDAIDVTVKHINKKPVANAGADQEVDENVVIMLDAAKSIDPDKVDIITYKWIAPAGITLDNASSKTPKFTSPVITEETLDYTFKLVVNDGKLNSDTDRVVVKVIHLNIAPVADAGADINIDENVNGNLDGSKSSDFESKPLTYNWLAPVGIVISNTSIAKPSFDAFEVQQDTVFNVILTVNDGVRNSMPDTVKITVNHINKQPVAKAGPDQTVNENVLVLLDGTASNDLDNYDIVTWSWTSLNGVILSSNTSKTPTFTTPWLMKDSVFIFKLIVNDGLMNSVADMVSVTVKHANLKPTASAGTDVSIDENTPGQLIGTGSTDPEGTTLTYLWNAPSGFIINNPTAVSPTFTAPAVDKNTDFEIILTVNDGKTVNNTDKDTVKVTVYQINKLPVADAGPDFSVREQKLVMLDGSASFDPDALDSLSFSWSAPEGITLDDPTSPKPFFLAPDINEDIVLSFELTITDKLKTIIKSANGSISGDNDIVIVTVTANKAPVANAGPNQKVRINNLVTLHGEGSSDPDGDVITRLWTAPEGITLTNPTSANPTFTAPDSDEDKSYLFTLEVTDDLGLKDSKDVTINVISNLPPVIVTETAVYVFEGETISIDASETSDPDGDVMVFDWFHGNADFINSVILLNKTKPVVSFVAPEVETLTYFPVILRVTDRTEDSYQTVKVYVKDILNMVPVADAGSDFDVNEGIPGILDGSASSDVEGKPVTYLWTSGYLVLNDNTAAKPGFTAPEVAIDTTLMITLVVNDGKWSSTPDTVMVSIKHVNKIPVAVAGSDIVINEGDKITFDGSASSDLDGVSIGYTWSAVGLSVTGGNLAIASAKAPEVQKDTKVPVLLVVNDGIANSIPDTVWVTIKQVNKAPVWVVVQDDVAFAGYEYSAKIKVTDPDLLDKITITSDNIPSWLTLIDNGNGTAALTTDSIPRMESLLGTHTFAIKATDGTVTINETIELTITIKTAIEDLTLSTVKFYPNPTNGLVNVEFNSLPERGTTIQVFNQLGQSVMIRKADGQINQLNLSPNPSGLYYIKLTTKNDSRTEKIILR